MIARIFFLLILLILIPDLYLYKHYVIRKKLSLGKRFLWWLPSLILIVFTIGLSTVKDFIPDTIEIISVYLLLLGVIVIPKAVYSICSALGLGYCRMIHSRKN